MNDDSAKAVVEEPRSWLTKKHSSLGIIIVTYLLFFLYFSKYFVQFVEEFPKRGNKLTYSVSMAAVAMILAGTYFYAYRSFKENFYFFLFVSWVANAFYLIPELNGPLIPGSENAGQIDADTYYRYRIGILLLSLVSSFFMWQAIKSPGDRKPARSTWNHAVAWGGGLTLLDAALIYRLYDRLAHPEFLQGVAGREHIVWLACWLLGGQVISFAIIWRVGDHIHARLGEATHGRKVYRIAQTFHVYAVLQFIYPFVPYLEARNNHVLLIPFLFAQVLKVLNAILMMGVLQSERDREIAAAAFALDESEEKLKRRTQLAELGALAASIKHDITTPLATMGSHIQKIKERFQHNKEIVSKMERLEQSMDRIAATVDVVDIVRGDATFYNRDKFMDKASMLEVVHRAVRSVKNEKPPMLSRTVIKVEGREVFVRAFVPMLEQVVVNVIKNALEAIGEAGRERGLINIRVNTTHLPESKYSRWVKVEVEDNGRGILQEHIDKLTTLFTTRSDKKPNSGIGLFMGKKIMNIHGGRIDFESVVGGGATVTLLLPEWNAFQKVAEETHTSASPEREAAPPAAANASNQEALADTTYTGTADMPQHSGGIV